MPSKHHAKRHHSKCANNKRTVKKNTRRHRRSHKKQTGGSPASRSVMDFVNTSGPALDDYAVGMELPSMDKITKCATQQMGGSLVSDAVMSAKMGMTDYQEQANLPAMNQLGGGSCGGNPKQAGGATGNKNNKNTQNLSVVLFGVLIPGFTLQSVFMDGKSLDAAQYSESIQALFKEI